jgi:hypothetical protein
MSNELQAAASPGTFPNIYKANKYFCTLGIKLYMMWEKSL